MIKRLFKINSKKCMILMIAISGIFSIYFIISYWLYNPSFHGKPFSYWIKCYKNEEMGCGREAVEAVIKLGPRARKLAPYLLNILNDENQLISERELAAYLLSFIGYRPAVPIMIKLYKNNDPEFRSDLISALGRIGDIRAIPIIIAAMRDENARVMEAGTCTIHYGDFGKAVEKTVPALIQVVENPYKYLKIDNKYGRKDKESIENAVGCSIMALGEIGNNAKPACQVLIKELKSEKWYRKEESAEAIGRVGCKEALPEIVRLLNDENELVRKAAKKAIERIEKEQ